MIDSVSQVNIEQYTGLAFLAVLAVVLSGQWLIMTFMWPQTHPQWAVWAKTTAFLAIVIARLIRYITGVERFPFPIGALINAASLGLVLYFGKVYLWDTWIRNKYADEGDHTHEAASRRGSARGRFRRGYGPYDRPDEPGSADPRD